MRNNWYVLAVDTGRENSRIKEIRAYNEEKAINNILPFVPSKETFFKREKEVSVMFPGYVFVETEMDAYDFLDYVKKVRRMYRSFIDILRYGDSDEMAVRWEERLVLMQLMNHEWCIKASTGFKEGVRVKIVEGSLVRQEAKIQRVDRNKMEAWVEVDMMGRQALIKVGLQFIEKA